MPKNILIQILCLSLFFSKWYIGSLKKMELLQSIWEEKIVHICCGDHANLLSFGKMIQQNKEYWILVFLPSSSLFLIANGYYCHCCQYIIIFRTVLIAVVNSVDKGGVYISDVYQSQRIQVLTHMWHLAWCQIICINTFTQQMIQQRLSILKSSWFQWMSKACA